MKSKPYLLMKLTKLEKNLKISVFFSSLLRCDFIMKYGGKRSEKCPTLLAWLIYKRIFDQSMTWSCIWLKEVLVFIGYLSRYTNSNETVREVNEFYVMKHWSSVEFISYSEKSTGHFIMNETRQKMLWKNREESGTESFRFGSRVRHRVNSWADFLFVLF